MLSLPLSLFLPHTPHTPHRFAILFYLRLAFDVVVASSASASALSLFLFSFLLRSHFLSHVQHRWCWLFV
jgi:hypothetical protein